MLEKVRGPSDSRRQWAGVPSPFKFEKKGKSGIEVSEVFPKLGEHVDDMAVMRSLWTDIPAHEVAQRFMHTGSLQLPKPSWGSWVVYGLGTENQNMPGFITLSGKPEWRQASFPAGRVSRRECELFVLACASKRSVEHPNQFTGSNVQRAQLDLAQNMNPDARSSFAPARRTTRVPDRGV
jgi:hypothetical protein